MASTLLTPGLDLETNNLSFVSLFFDLKLSRSRFLVPGWQRLTFPFPFVHHQPHAQKVEQQLTMETKT